MLQKLEWSSHCLESLDEMHPAFHCYCIRVLRDRMKRRGEPQVQQCQGIRQSGREETINDYVTAKAETQGKCRGLPKLWRLGS